MPGRWTSEMTRRGTRPVVSTDILGPDRRDTRHQISAMWSSLGMASRMFWCPTGVTSTCVSESAYGVLGLARCKQASDRAAIGDVLLPACRCLTHLDWRHR